MNMLRKNFRFLYRCRAHGIHVLALTTDCARAFYTGRHYWTGGVIIKSIDIRLADACRTLADTHSGADKKLLAEPRLAQKGLPPCSNGQSCMRCAPRLEMTIRSGSRGSVHAAGQFTATIRSTTKFLLASSGVKTGIRSFSWVINARTACLES